METAEIVKIAVSAAPYSIDKPYDYWVPEPFSDSALLGVRVTVPFGRGNRTSEGIILARAIGIKRKTLSLSVLCWTENRYWIRMELPWPSGCASGISAHCLRL